MIVGVGVDLVDLARFEQKLADTPALLERLFHIDERSYSPRRLAGSFAAKEALVKALGGPDGLSWTEISVERDSLGRPWLRTQGSSAQRLDHAGADRIHLSISHDGGMLTAYVIAESTSGGRDA